MLELRVLQFPPTLSLIVTFLSPVALAGIYVTLLSYVGQTKAHYPGRNPSCNNSAPKLHWVSGW